MYSNTITIPPCFAVIGLFRIKKSAKKASVNEKGDYEKNDVHGKMSTTVNGSVQLQLLNGDTPTVEHGSGDPADQPNPSLSLALIRGFWKTFIFGSFFKLWHDVLMFCSPLLLR